MQQDFEELTQYLNQLSKNFNSRFLQKVFMNCEAKFFGYIASGFIYHIPLDQNYVIVLQRTTKNLRVEFGYKENRSFSFLHYNDPEIQRFRPEIFEKLNFLKDALESYDRNANHQSPKKTMAGQIIEEKKGRVIIGKSVTPKKLEINLFDLFIPLIDKVVEETKSERIRIRGINDIQEKLEKQETHISKNQIGYVLSKISVLKKDSEKPCQFTTTQTEWRDYKSKLKKK